MSINLDYFKFFLLFSALYTFNYGIPFVVWNFLFKMDTLVSETIHIINKICTTNGTEDDEDIMITSNPEDISMINITEKEEPKYEDKYLEQVRKMNKEWDYKAYEIQEQMELAETFYHEAKNNLLSNINEIKDQISKLNKEEEEDNREDIYYDNDGNEYNPNNQVIEDDDDEDDGDNEDKEEWDYKNFMTKVTFEERSENRKNKLDALQKELDQKLELIDSQEATRQFLEESEKKSWDIIIGKRIDKLANCFVMDSTPLGNVLMIYNKDRESFSYYSDANIPYRYLEPLARKYVKSFNCRPLYIDMEEELKLIEEKWDREQELKKMKEEEEAKRSSELSGSGINSLQKAEDSNKKKNVFARLKSYNKDSGGGGKISMAAPPKNSIPGKSVVPETKENAKILLKERANRYTYEGKFANFSFLKKVERKVFNKKLGLTFAEFKASLGKNGSKP